MQRDQFELFDSSKKFFGVQNCLKSKLHNHVLARRYMATWLLGYMATWLQRQTAAASQSYSCNRVPNFLGKRGRLNDSELSVFSDDTEAGGNGILVGRFWLSLV